MPRIRIPRTLLLALGLILFVSCAEPTCACDPAPDHAVVYGRVTDPAGAAVADSRVRSEIGPPGCQPWVDEREATTAPDGRYRMRIASGGGPESERCQRMFALPPAGSALRGSDTVPLSVRFRPAETPADSVRVDLVLRAP